MKGEKGMLNSIVCHTEFWGKGRTSRRKFLTDIWKFGVRGVDLGAMCIQMNARRMEVLSEVE